METARHRRSKSATALEGNFPTQKQNAVPKLVSDSRSHSRGITKEDVVSNKFTFELEKNSLKQGSGTPIKKLMAQEMAKESETRRRSPSVIARLMGLDGLPSPQNGHKQQRRLSEKHQQRNASIDNHQNEKSYVGRSSRMSSVDQQDFKDVYEDMEASHVTNHRYLSRWNTNSRLSKHEMALIQQNFMDAKHLSTNEKLQVSKELDDTLEILDSRKDLQLKYLDQPDSLFPKNLHDLQVDPSSSFYERMESLEQANSVEHEGSPKAWNSAKDGSYKRDIRSRQRRKDGLLLQSRNHHSSYSSCKAEKSQSNVKDETNILPTRIVVLKPNIVKRANAVTPVSLPESSHAHLPSVRKRLQYTGSGSEEVLLCKNKNYSNEVCFLKSKSREDRDIAKEITRQMREQFRPSSGLRGYAGDASSYDVYESDYFSASEVMSLSSINSFDGNNCIEHSSSGPCESLVSKEAKKRLSERWKMTHKCQSFEPVAKGSSTLGEMLAVPERETVHEHFDAAICLDGASARFSGSSDSSGCNGPLGISSSDGWKDGCIRKSSRSRSLPSSLSGSRSCKKNGRHEPSRNDLVKNEKISRGRSRFRKGNPSKKEDSPLSIDLRSSNWKSHPCHGNCNDGVNSCLYQADISSYKEDQLEKHFLHCPEPLITDSCRSFISDVLTNAKPEGLTFSWDSSNDLHPKHIDSIRRHDHSSARCQEDADLQEPALGQSEGSSASLKCPGPEPESSESSKDADHSTPVSVLEVSFAEDVSSSSDCFEKVNAELNELRMQLQLLKMESGGFTDTPMLVSSNRGVMQQLRQTVFGEKCIVGGDNWESTYIVDVLHYSGLEEFDPDASFASWHSPECPLGPWVFNNLEKKYNGETTALRFERMLLFDRINSALLEIFQQYVDNCYWMQPMMIGVAKWKKHWVKDYLHKLLANQETKVNADRPENVLDREMNWLGSKSGIDFVGEEIEKLLIDDLIGEVVAM